MGRLGNLNTAHYARLIRTYGRVPAGWHRRVGPCPRPHVATVGGFQIGADPHCPLCGGTGELLQEMALPTTGRTGGKVYYQNCTQTMLRQMPGLEVGDLLLSFFPDEYPLLEGDRLFLSDREARASQQLKRGTGSSDRLTLPRAVGLLQLVSEDGAATGYSLDAAGGHVVWDPDTGLAAGKQYTVAYRYLPAYVVFQGTFVQRPVSDDGTPFPARVALKRYQFAATDQPSGLGWP
jgi:hypothetical protein